MADILHVQLNSGETCLLFIHACNAKSQSPWCRSAQVVLTLIMLQHLFTAEFLTV